MTGTSLDGLDAAAAEFEGRGLDLRLRRVAGLVSRPLPMHGTLARLAAGEPVAAGEIAEAARALGEAHADAIAGLIEPGTGVPDLVVLHGQTVFHRPPTSWQLVNPWPVAARFGCAVVSDLRGLDLALGGQGAPVTPLADWVLFRADAEPRAIVNLGGFANATLLPAGATPERVRGADLCACNQLLDAAARHALNRPFDADGAGALAGTPDEAATAELVRTLLAQAASGRSLGTGDEALAWLDRTRTTLAGPALLASAAAGVGGAVGRLLRERSPGARVFLAGGGAHNRAVVRAIDRALAHPSRPLADLGVPGGAREAVEFAALGLLAADGVAITLPAITGRGTPARVPLHGQWILPSEPHA
jgi:1,6-anhydro-N-acetylmuramate kinase